MAILALLVWGIAKGDVHEDMKKREAVKEKIDVPFDFFCASGGFLGVFGAVPGVDLGPGNRPEGVRGGLGELLEGPFCCEKRVLRKT